MIRSAMRGLNVRSTLVLQGVLFVLFTGIGWEDLPQELGFGSGMTCWRRYGIGNRSACSTSSTRCCWLI